MLIKMMDLMAEKPAFIAVGAGHLPGKVGLIHMLKGEGYDVSPVKFKFTTP